MKCHFVGAPDRFARMRRLFTEPAKETRWQKIRRWFLAAYREAQEQSQHVVNGRAWF